MTHQEIKNSSEYPIWLYDLVETPLTLEDKWVLYNIDREFAKPLRTEVRSMFNSVKRYRLKEIQREIITRDGDIDDDRDFADDDSVASDDEEISIIGYEINNPSSKKEEDDIEDYM